MKKVIPFLSLIILLITTAPAYTGRKELSYRIDSWSLLTDDVTATVYNAVPSQCNADYVHTASMLTLNLDDIASNHVLAMERTMMKELGVHYGDIVLVTGAGHHDGIWRVEDTMNKRFAGEHRIDFLVPSHIRYGKWTGVRIYAPADEWTREAALLRLSGGNANRLAAQ